MSRHGIKYAKGVQGAVPSLNTYQRQFIRAIQLKREALTRQIHALIDERAALPGAKKLAAEFEVCQNTIHKALRGSNYANGDKTRPAAQVSQCP